MAIKLVGLGDMTKLSKASSKVCDRMTLLLAKKKWSEEDRSNLETLGYVLQCINNSVKLSESEDYKAGLVGDFVPLRKPIPDLSKEGE